MTPAAGTRASAAISNDAADATRNIVERARAGDALAFAALLHGHYDFIFATAFKWSGNRADAEDVAQDVCMKLGASIRYFDGRSAFSTWLYRVTLNAVRDLQRSRSRSARQAVSFALVSPDAEPPGQFESVALGDLWRAVRALPEKQRDAVLLVYAEELSHSAASEILGCAEATVSWHIHEAKKTLKGLL